MGGPWSVVGAVLAMGMLGVMIAAPWSTRATGQAARPNAAKGEHKPAPPALLATPEPQDDTLTVAELVRREGPNSKMFPGKPISFRASS